MEMCLFPARVGISAIDAVFYQNTFPYLHLDLACKRLCFLPRKRYKYEKWKYQDTVDIDLTGSNNQSTFVFPTTIVSIVNKMISFKRIQS